MCVSSPSVLMAESGSTPKSSLRLAFRKANLSVVYNVMDTHIGVTVSHCVGSKAVMESSRSTASGFWEDKKFWNHFSIYACHLCARAMLIFSVSFQF